MKSDELLWIQEFTFDAIQNRVRIVLTSDPDKGTVDREVIVSKITKFVIERYHESDAATLGDYRGCKTIKLVDSWRYEIDTGDATVSFEAQENVVF